MFHDVTLDFTDSNGKTLDTIVIAGINGSGKTSLLQLLQKLFSESLNLSPSESFLHKYDEKALICDEIELELELSNDEKSGITDFFDRYLPQQVEITEPFKCLISEKFKYKLERIERGLHIQKNDFPILGSIKAGEHLFKILYFSAEHEHIKWKRYNNQLDSVMPIDIFSHRETVETHIVNMVKDKLIDNRDLIASAVIKQAILKINQLLNGISLKTKLVDIDSKQPIFKSCYGQNVFTHELSDGEKQLYYKAILLDKLNPQNSLIMVDEPETSLHPTWQQEVFKLYNNIPGNNQVILVTHSPHIIASVHPKNLFILKINDKEKTVECFNAQKESLHTRGNEPNDILDEIMGTPLRDLETQERIKKVIDLLRSQPDKINEPKNEEMIESLIEDLGRSDPIIMRIIHKINIIQAG